jgi:hypothetical protein
MTVKKHSDYLLNYTYKVIIFSTAQLNGRIKEAHAPARD